jgi:hypothetical protein
LRSRTRRAGRYLQPRCYPVEALREQIKSRAVGAVERVHGPPARDARQPAGGRSPAEFLIR